MKPALLGALEDFRNILGVCPCCGDLFRLTDIQLSYRSMPRKTWLDALEEEDAKLTRAEDGFAEREERVREEARQRGRRRLPALLRKAEPIFSRRGFYPQDVKALFDPVDFVIFDGMNRAGHVRRVVLFDGPPDGSAREKLQRSVERTVRAGNYEWKTIRITKAGRIEAKGPGPKSGA